MRRALPGGLVVLAVPAILAASAFAREDLGVATRLIYMRSAVTLKTGTEAGEVEFGPRTAARPGVEARYGNLGVSMSLPAADVEWGGPALLAPRDLNDFRVRYHGSAWGVDAYHRQARGFSARPETVARGGVEEVAHPDLSLLASGASLYRAFDPDSRVNHLSDGLLETGGSIDFFLMLGVSRSSLRDAKPLLAGIAGTADSRFAGLRRLEVSSLSIGGGYGFSSNLHGLYFDQALFAGYGPQYREWGGRPDWEWNLAKVNLRMRLGYRTRWFDLGAGFENDAHVAIADGESAYFHSLAAQAGLEVHL